MYLFALEASLCPPQISLGPDKKGTHKIIIQKN